MPGTDAPSGPASDAPAVLLVDDRPDKLTALAAALEGLDVSLVTATSGKEALRHLLAREFAVILLDVNMPVMDGFETAALIRARQATEHTPIIFVTGINDTENHVSRGYSLGAVDYIFTPVISEVLRAKVSVFLDLFRRNRDFRRRAELLATDAERRAANLENRLETLLNRVNVGVFRCTVGGRLINANPSFLRIFGMHPAIDLGAVNMASLYLRPEDRGAIVAELEREGQVQHQVQQRRLDGRLIWVAMSKALVVGEDGSRMIDGLVEDITQRKEAEEALVVKSEELARSNAELEQFAYIASHDLQEPLRMISSFSSLLESRYAERFDERGRGFLARVVEGAMRMQRMIRDILSYSRVDRMETMVDAECGEIVERALFNLQGAISEIRAEVAVGTLPRIRGDPMMLSQVFQNLISNGLKFRRPGVVPRIAISAEREDGMWWLSVADNGIGILPEHRDRIFGVFQRLHTRDAYEGNGIGLAVCRKVVQRHGGRIAVDGDPGVGSVFRFSLPAALESGAARNAAPAGVVDPA